MNEGTSLFRLVNAQIRYYFKIDPSTLTDNEWAMYWNDLQWLRKEELKQSLNKISL